MRQNMNKIFKIVWNAARGKMMVVNEATSSVQTGKKAAVTVAVIGALASGVASAATELTNTTTVPISGGEYYLTSDVELTYNEQLMVQDATIDLDGNSLTLEGTKNHEGLGDGVIKNTTIVGGGGVTIKQVAEDGDCIFARGTQSITANNINLSSANTWVAYLDWSGDKVTLDANNGGNVDTNDLTNHTIIISGSSGGGGVYLRPGSEFIAKNFNYLKLENVADEDDHGYGVNNNGGNFTVENGGLVEISADERSALVSYDANAVTDISAQKIVVASTIKNETDAFKASGVGMKAGQMSLIADEVDISVTGLETQGNIYGVSALAGANLEVTSSKLDIQAEGSSSYGLMTEGATVELNGGTSTISAGKYGIYAKSGSTVELSGTNIELSAAGTGVLGWGSNVTLGSENTDYVKVDVLGVDTSATNDNAKGIWSYDEGTLVTVKGKQLEVNVDGQGVETTYGIYVQGDINTNSDDNGAIVIEAKKTSVEVKGATGANVGLCAMAEGGLTVNGDLVVSADLAIVARGNSVIDINASGDNTVQIDGDIKFDFDAETSGTAIESTVNLNLSNADSYLNGNILKDNEVSGAKGEVTGMTLGLDNGAKWASTEASFVNTLNLDADNDGVGGVVDISANAGDVTVDAAISGQGTVVVDASKTGDAANKLIVANDVDGADSVVLTVQASENADKVTEEQAKALASRVSGVKAENTTGYVEEGMYNGAMTVTTSADGQAKVATATNSVMSNTLDLASAAPLAMNRLLMNDVRKRMGDLRAAEGTHGVWARYDGGKLSGSNSLENDFTTIQVGIDTVPVVDAPRFGVAFSFTTSDADMKRGGAEMDAYSLAFYGTKFYDNGMFVDVIGRMATADTDVTVDGNKKGSMGNVALSLSGELGWRFDVTEKFYFEPQAELTYTYVNADTLALANGGTYEFDSVDSLMARVGFAAGFKCPNNFGDVYVRASAVHEFLGDATVRGGTEIHEVAGEDTWVEFGIGAQFNVNKNTYVYADIERTEGAKLEEDWRANVGVRFAF